MTEGEALYSLFIEASDAPDAIVAGNVKKYTVKGSKKFRCDCRRKDLARKRARPNGSAAGGRVTCGIKLCLTHNTPGQLLRPGVTFSCYYLSQLAWFHNRRRRRVCQPPASRAALRTLPGLFILTCQLRLSPGAFLKAS